jgi:spermidine synthase/tetratricopeptide (TPR) repeat protein/MFS family permease
MQYSRLKALLVLLFALSGVCGLIYEISWSKYLSLFIGSTSYSHMIVLATFMGGLALGAHFLGKYADRSANPLKLYAILELIIGIYGVIYPFLMIVCEKLFISVAVGLNLASNQMFLTLLKFLLSVVTILLPTFCMGGTLPVLLKLLAKSVDETGKEVARLYWVNSFGAVLGTALAGFFLIRLYTLDGTIWIAAAVNILVGIAAYILAKDIKQESSVSQTPDKSSTAAKYPQSIITPAIAVAVGSGFISMVYELTWIRLLTTLLGSSTYSFSVMLIAFIGGIALGGWIISIVIGRVKNLMFLLAICQAGAALFMLATLPLYERLPYYLWKLSTLLSNTPENFPLFLFFEFLFCFVLMIIPTTFSGMSLPVVAKIAAGDMKALGKNVGNVFSLNTIGAVAGAVITGLIFIPQLGVKQSIELGVALNAVLAVVVIMKDPRAVTPWKIGVAAMLFLSGFAYRTAFPKWNENVSTVGVYRAFFKEAPVSYENFFKEIEDRSTLWYKEGVTANVAVNEFTNDNGNRERSLVINGKADASTENDLPTQVLLAQIPLILGQNTSDVLVIGLGSGITSGSALQHPIRSLDCVEISPEVVECNYLFTEYNHDFSKDPRVRMVVDDAVTFVKVNPKKYSCIISEPSNPWIAGIGNLFTSEFFELCKERLEPGGVLAQWFHTYDVNSDVFKLVLRTISKSFPYVALWAPSDADMILVASMDPLQPQFDDIGRKIELPSVKKELERIQMFDVPSFLSAQLTSYAHPVFSSNSGPINSEKQPLLEFLAPLSFFTHSRLNFSDVIERLIPPNDSTLLLAQYNRKFGLNADDFLNVAKYHFYVAIEDYRLAYQAVQECLRHNPNDRGGLQLLAALAGVVNATEERLSALERLITVEPDNPELLATFANEYFEWRKQIASPQFIEELSVPIRLLQESLELSGRNDERYFIWLGNILTSAQRFEDAGEAYGAALKLRDTYEAVENSVSDEQLAFQAADRYLTAGNFEQADQYVERLKLINPSHSQLPNLIQQLTAGKKGAL